jgi:glutamate--cysteine ligase
VSIPSAQNTTPLTDKAQLIERLESGCKPKDRWRIGTEHEKFAYDVATCKPLTYDAPNGIRTVLNELQRFGWEPMNEGENVIGLSKDGQHVSLEPGGQLELSGAPLENLHQTCRETNAHLDQCKEIAEELGISFLGLGFRPRETREDVPWMPKGRYKIMRAYMPKVGTMGLDMMLRTCTIQANLDFGSEADMVKKFRVAQALQSVATALFANSPFTENKPNGYLSMRAHVWTDVDNDRSGLLKFMTEEGFGFERYVDYALDVPMYFVMREGKYIDASGQSFRDFLNGKLPALPGEIPTVSDWEDHLTTLFPDVRIKRYMEVRGADGAGWRRICALPGLWTGLLYEQTALDAAWDMVKDWTWEEQVKMKADVPALGLKTPFRDGTVQDVAQDMLAISAEGLRLRRIYDGSLDEVHFLDALMEIAISGRTPAEDLLDRYENAWKGDIEKVFTDYAF